jgi:hypothetical protein
MFHEKQPLGAELTPELAALQAQLARLQPAPLTLDRDRLMFAAGRAAAESDTTIAATPRAAGAPRWVWPSATALMTAACLVLSLVLIWRDETPNVAVQPTDPQPAADKFVAEPTIEDFRSVEELTSRFASARSSKPTRGYLNVRHVALTEGVNAIANDRTANGNGDSSHEAESAEPATPRDLLKDLLPSEASAGRIRS